MKTCKICGEKKATKNHIEKTHKMDYQDYLKKYDSEFFAEKEVLQALNDLFITTRSKWAELDRFGEYSTKHKQGKRGLITKDLKDHLQQKKTVAVYPMAEHSKWLIFDIDTNPNETIETAKERLEKVFNAINNYFESEFINISFSGKKGYHIELFFNNSIEKTALEKFYKLILSESGENKTTVEGRGFTNQAIKLPLGINFRGRAGAENYCYYCNRAGQDLRDDLYITKIKKIDRAFFYDIVEINFNESISDEELKQFEEIQQTTKSLKIYEMTPVENIEKLIKEGITEAGTRHQKSLILITYCKEKLNYTEEQTQEFLESWTFNTCKKELYKTEPNQIKKELRQSIRTAYKSNYKLKTDKKKVGITQDEIREILTPKKAVLKKLYWILFIHCKTLSGIGKTFYMTYKQMEEAGATKGNRATIKKNLIELMAEGKLEIVSSNQQGKGHLKKPNKYRLKAFTEKAEEIKKTFKKCEVEKCKDCFNKCVNYLLNPKEIKQMITRRNLEEFKNKTCRINK